MTLVKCLECGSEQDFEEAVGYCEQCGRKLPVPHRRGKDAARRKLLTDGPAAEVGSANVAVTAVLFVAGLAAVLILAVLVLRSQF
jgi:uncharacterized membrane protein YvbJ